MNHPVKVMYMRCRECDMECHGSAMIDECVNKILHPDNHLAHDRDIGMPT